MGLVYAAPLTPLAPPQLISIYCQSHGAFGLVDNRGPQAGRHRQSCWNLALGVFFLSSTSKPSWIKPTRRWVKMMQRQPTVEIAQPTVPEGFKAGDRLQATFPNGESIMISIPEGAAPFDGLWIEVRRGRWVPARAAKWLFKSLLFTLGCGLVFAGFGLMRCPIHWLLWVLCCLLTCCFCLCAHTNGGKACNIFATWTCLGCPILGLLALVRQLFLCDPEHDMGIDDGPYLAILAERTATRNCVHIA